MRPMASPSARTTWSFMIYAGSSRRAAILAGRIQERNPRHRKLPRLSWPSDAPRSKATKCATKFCGIELRWLKIGSHFKAAGRAF